MSREPDAARAYLARRGCSALVVEGGLDGLLLRWRALAESLEGEYELGLDDWLNDLDVRQILGDVWGELSPEEAARRAPELEQADRLLRARTRPHEHCLWGQDVACRLGYSAERQWWYYLLPLRHGDELARDVGRVR